MCCLVLWSSFALLLTIQFASLFFFLPRFCPGHISGTVTRRDSKLSVLLGPAVYFCTIAYHPIRFVIGPKFGGSLLGRIQGDREPVSYALWVLSDLLAFVRLQDFPPTDPAPFHPLVTALACALPIRLRYPSPIPPSLSPSLRVLLVSPPSLF